MIIDMSVKNGNGLYNGCQIEETAGRNNLVTPIAQAVSIIGRNANSIIEGTAAADRQEVTLTGPAPIWAYLVVFHCLVHKYTKVYYDDGRGNRCLVAAHGA